MLVDTHMFIHPHIIDSRLERASIGAGESNMADIQRERLK